MIVCDVCMLHWKGMSAQSWVSGVCIFVVGRDIVRELRKNCRSGNCGFRESRGGGPGRKGLGRGLEGSFSGNLAEGLGPEQRANFQDHFPGDRAQRTGHMGWGGNAEPL